MFAPSQCFGNIYNSVHCMHEDSSDGLVIFLEGKKKKQIFILVVSGQNDKHTRFEIQNTA